MINLKNISLAGSWIAAGIVGALFAAPLFNQVDGTGQIRPMWANRYQSLEHMTADADAVVLAQVREVMPGRLVYDSRGNNPLPFTWIDMEIDRVLAGEAPDVVTVEQTGGTVGDLTSYVLDDGGQYQAGDHELLFLKLQPESGFYIVSHPKGRFLVQDGELYAATPEDPVSRELDGLSVRQAAAKIAALAGK